MRTPSRAHNPDAGLLPVPAPASSLPHRPDATFASAAGEGRLPVRVPMHAHAVQHAGRAGPRRSAFAAGPAGADTERPRLLPAFALLGHGGAARGARPLPEAVCRARVHLGRPLRQEGSGPSDALPSRKALLSDGLPSGRGAARGAQRGRRVRLGRPHQGPGDLPRVRADEPRGAGAAPAARPTPGRGPSR